MDGTRACIYTRISLDQTGEGLAVARQLADCRRIAETRGWRVVAEHSDTVSATDRRKARPGYDAVVESYRRGEFDALIVWDLDRLTRQPRQLEDWIEAAESRGLRLVTANGEADLATDSGRLFARIKASVGRSETDRKSARQRAAALQRSQIGRPPLGVRLTGYTPQGEIIPAEAAVVRDVFDGFARGDSLRSLAARLTEAGVPTRHGRPWHPSSVRTMLTNPRYAGRAVYQGAATGGRGGWEPLVSDDVFDAIQATLADPRRRSQQGTDRRYLLAGLARCGVCGETCSSFSGKRYRCRAGCVTRSATLIDNYVEKIIRERLARPDLVSLITPEDSEHARAVGERVRHLRARMATIEADYDAGDIDGRRYRTATEKVTAALAEAQREQARLSTTAGAARLLAAPDPVTEYDRAPLMIRRGVVDSLTAIRLHPAPRGRRGLDPATVTVEWRSDLGE